jgi:tRNA dimethylallyltransferase
MEQVLFLVGPTGAGKSELALKIAKKINGEIISCDAMQVYRGMNIGTAKPTPKEQKSVPHHLINLVSPKSECSVFKHRLLALDAIRKIHSKGKLPIVVGGSGLYIKALLNGIAPQPGRKSKVRKKLELEAQKNGLSRLYSKLKRLDPKRAQEIHPHDKRRIIRALEIFELSKKKPSRWHEETTGSLESFGIKPVIFGLTRKREELYKRIERRVDRMFEQGWVNEVKWIKRLGFSKTAFAAIGYREILEYLKGKRSIEDAKSEIKKRTRHLAKRQFTWFRRNPRIEWIRPKAARTILNKFGVVSV